ncbi:MAG: aminotransferase class I/II-fold pyridoxal phosphate-dependent enzyme [Aminipila sp.]
MKIDSFILENWLNPACDSEKNEIYLGGSCVLPMTLEELFDLTGENINNFFEELKKMNLGYGRFDGTARCRNAVASIYKNVRPDEVVLVHGGTGANNNVINTLVEPGDKVVSIVPSYQQFYSIPESLGAKVYKVYLKPEEGYKLSMDKLREAVDSNVKAIFFTNPNNPTGALLSLSEMEEIVEIAKKAECWIVCDEMYRGLKDEYMYSFADIYEKAIVTCSSSKIYSMAGLRVGWIICHDSEMQWQLFNRRSFDSICGGNFDEWLFAIALEHSDKIYARSRKIVNDNKAIIDKWLKTQTYLHQYADSYGSTYFIHYDLNVDAQKFCDDLLDRKGVLICHGDCFDVPHTFRLSLAHAEHLEEGLKRIAEYIEELVKEGHSL